MHFTYDPEADAAYLSLTQASLTSAMQLPAISAADMDGEVHFDLDREGRIIGIEFVHASLILPKELLSAEGS